MPNYQTQTSKLIPAPTWQRRCHMQQLQLITNQRKYHESFLIPRTIKDRNVLQSSSDALGSQKSERYLVLGPSCIRILHNLCIQLYINLCCTSELSDFLAEGLTAESYMTNKNLITKARLSLTRSLTH